MGSDMRPIIYHVSIHAPTKGATSDTPEEFREKFNVSIHAPTKGATEAMELRKTFKTVSIHAPTKGATFSHFD